MTARSATITFLPIRAEACTTALGWSRAAVGAGQSSRPPRKREPGMIAYQQWLATLFALRIRSLANSPAMTAAARNRAPPASFFIFDKHQVHRGCLRNAGNSTDFDRAISHHLRLAPPGQPKGATASLHLCIRLARERKAGPGLECWHGEENLLGRFHCVGPGRRFHPADLVGAAGNDPIAYAELVDCLPQRLVLE